MANLPQATAVRSVGPAPASTTVSSVLQFDSYKSHEAVLYMFRDLDVGYIEIYIPSLRCTFDLTRKLIHVQELQKSNPDSLVRRVSEHVDTAGPCSAYDHKRVTLTTVQYDKCLLARDRELSIRAPLRNACRALNMVFHQNPI